MPKVGIIMGSDSDLKVMGKAAETLEAFGVEYEMHIISAHREADVLVEYCQKAADRGIRVLITGAGLAAALPGMCAALFPLPVIGVPLKGGALNGQDALYSIVQMPPGVPVATVGIDGAKNAALLAVRMLAVSDDALLEKLKAFSAEQKEQVIAKDARLVEVGYQNY